MTNAMPAANAAMAERQKQQARALAAEEAAADAREQRKATFGLKVGARAGVRKGLNLVNGLSREEHERLPVSVEELTRMSSNREDLRFGKHAKGSKKQIEMGTRHWHSFCARFNVPRFLMTNTIEGIRAATAQA